jgi:hypothetical protein
VYYKLKRRLLELCRFSHHSDGRCLEGACRVRSSIESGGLKFQVVRKPG